MSGQALFSSVTDAKLLEDYERMSAPEGLASYTQALVDFVHHSLSNEDRSRAWFSATYPSIPFTPEKYARGFAEYQLTLMRDELTRRSAEVVPAGPIKKQHWAVRFIKAVYENDKERARQAQAYYEANPVAWHIDQLRWEIGQSHRQDRQ